MIYVDPFNIIQKENEDLCYKQSFLLFTVAVAGKTASVTSKKINNVISDIMDDKRGDIFNTIKDKYEKNDYLGFYLILKKHKTGKYNTIVNFIKDYNKSNIDLNNCSVSELESLSGIGKKSSRYYLLYNNKNKEDYAVLDTHILRFMKRFGIETPKITPTGKKYDELEKNYLDIYHKSGFIGTLQEFDYKIWETQGKIVLPKSDDTIQKLISKKQYKKMRP